jgi:esterase/lipase superfamily enzyme
MANDEHAEWLKHGHKEWNERRRLIHFTPDLSGINFEFVLYELGSKGNNKSFFSRFNFSDANLREANLEGLNFSRANFSNADLTRAILSNGNFKHARFDRANLTNVIAQNAIFVEARLNDARLIGMELSGANLNAAEIDLQRLSAEQVDAIGELSPPMHLQIGLREDRARFITKQDREQTYLVTYGTNRKPIWEQDEIRFGSERDNKLNYGACQVFVPQSHKVGSLGSPFWKRLLKGDDRLKIRKITELNRDLYWTLIRENFTSSQGASPPTVLIHGYNTSFESAVLWAAQIGYDLGLERGVGLFSWPSVGKIRSYQADEATVEASKYYLADYLLEFAEQAKGIGINILAHSMGSRCLAAALEIIGTRHPGKLDQFNQIIFAAADVDQDVMRAVGAHIVANTGRTTSYVCSKDKAVQLSATLHGYARVGFLPPVFTMDDIDTIEVERSNLLELGHSYVSSFKEILGDIHQLIRSSTPPEKRFLIRSASSGSKGHWTLKE